MLSNIGLWSCTDLPRVTGKVIRGDWVKTQINRLMNWWQGPPASYLLQASELQNGNHNLFSQRFCFFFFFYFFAMPSNIRISVPQPESEPGPWQWKPRILTTRPPENSRLAGFYWKVVEVMYVCHRPSTGVNSFPYSLFSVNRRPWPVRGTGCFPEETTKYLQSFC